MDKLQKFIGFADERGLEEQIGKVEFRLATETLTMKEEKLCLQKIAELKGRRPLLVKLRDMKSSLSN
jgi:uncharacterized coiled-coil DUF342 family protein